MSGTEGGAFGAGKAGTPFDPVAFIKKPQVILRLASTVWAMVVFGCISAEGWYDGHCQMKDDSNACNYGVGIGVLAFLICIGFLVVDGLFENISSVQYRKYVVIADMCVSALWTFLWFVGFCYMTDAWNHSPDASPYRAPHGHGRDHVQAAIAFSFFSIASWGGLTFFAVRRYREGSQETFTQGYETEQNASSPYSSFPGSDTGDPYQQPPFSGQKEAPDFQPPTY
ncbi:synaptogyrin-2-like [Pecten maximus]|uniref:synaptogyrin-2-like n=1 Tax=Pecten maximus TaxID=6579 RepID=UPI001458910B|nr:synaptogyrin-2-like [Pecten maximus]